MGWQVSGLHRTGARFVFELLTLHPTHASYRVRIERPDEPAMCGEVTIGAGDAPITEVVWDNTAAVAADDARFVAGLARAIQSGARRQEGWPRRVARWRGSASDET